jgi:hypothetical protein
VQSPTEAADGGVGFLARAGIRHEEVLARVVGIWLRGPCRLSTFGVFDLHGPYRLSTTGVFDQTPYEGYSGYSLPGVSDRLRGPYWL